MVWVVVTIGFILAVSILLFGSGSVGGGRRGRAVTSLVPGGGYR